MVRFLPKRIVVGSPKLQSSKARLHRHAPTGIAGFDEVTGGGVPAGRVTVVLGGAGSGKTIFGIQTLAIGARDLGEPGIFVAFEESAEQVLANTASFGWGLDRLQGKSIDILDARLSQSVVHGGDFDLLGLLSVLGSKAKAIGAKRVVFDGLDVLLAQLADASLARREVFRLQEWSQDARMTTILTAKADPFHVRPAADYDFLQFMADCVVTMQHRIVNGTASRFLCVAKYRGSAHSANELPFTIGDKGIEVAAVTSAELNHSVSNERITTGIERLDSMLSGGYYRGSATLITGAPGTAKTTIAAAFAEAASQRNERTLFVSFDESPDQIVRNVASVGIHLAPHVQTGALHFCSLRSRSASPQAHVAHVRSLLRELQVHHLVVDSISALGHLGIASLEEAAAVQILDMAKSQGITSVSTSLLGGKGATTEETPVGISTVADTWMHLSYVIQGGERNRALSIVKSRGTAHSSQVRELVMSSSGVTLADVYSVGGEVLMGTHRWERENAERYSLRAREREADLRQKEAELALAETKARAQANLSEQAVREATLERLKAEREEAASRTDRVTSELRRRRGVDALPAKLPAKRRKARQ